MPAGAATSTRRTVSSNAGARKERDPLIIGRLRVLDKGSTIIIRCVIHALDEVHGVAPGQGVQAFLDHACYDVVGEDWRMIQWLHQMLDP